MTDPLTEVLRSVRLTGGVFLDSHFTAPWSVHTKLGAEDIKAYLATPTQLIAYHFIIEGTLQVGVEGGEAIEVSAGEIVLLPRNDAHTLSSIPGVKPVSARQLIQPPKDGGLPMISHGGGGEAVHLVCGFLGGTGLYNPLFDTLPRLLKIDVRQATSRDWVEASVRFAASGLREGSFASSSVMSRLSETLFVEAVREYASTLDDQEAGWLRGLADPHVGRALALIHHNIGMDWSNDALAKQAGLSRSAFVERFTALVGLPPIRYLTAWRLQTAKLNLSETHKSIAQLAHSVGYESEEAFSRAFKRMFGQSPARWREQRAAA